MKRKTHNTPSTRKLMDARARLVTPAKPQVPWMPHLPMRNAILALRKLERKFQRLYTDAEKRIDNYLAQFKDMDTKIKERKKEVMLEKEVGASQERLIAKAKKLQKKIDGFAKDMKTLNVRIAA